MGRIASTLRHWLLGAALAVSLLIVSAAVFVYSGIYDVSAIEQHTGPVHWLIETTMRQSVKRRAAAQPPPPLSDPERIERGFVLYRQHCQQCHGGPGVAPEPFALGMTPIPVSLVHAGREWTAAEIRWVVEQGVKMTAMPAWRFRMSRSELWDTVAFVMHLPDLTAADYAELSSRLAAPDQHRNSGVSGRSLRTMAPEPLERARQTIRQYGCTACHVIPGVVGSDVQVGPPLDGMGRRSFIAGVLANTPENMVRWLRSPSSVDPLTTMPDQGVSEEDAWRIAGFLSTLDRPEQER